MIGVSASLHFAMASCSRVGACRTRNRLRGARIAGRHGPTLRLERTSSRRGQTTDHAIRRTLRTVVGPTPMRDVIAAP
jgi:hypothetical protein